VDIRLDQVNIVVRDMDAMAEFYGQLGLELEPGMPEWAPHHRGANPVGGASVDLDSTAFTPLWNEGWPGGGGILLNFRVPGRDDVDSLFEQLTSAGYGSQQEPCDRFWGSRYAVVTDPDGNAVGLMSPPEEAHRTAPPEVPS
jgi:catechol 2,3-dioxygenase-like lactoylglutathione lyase family enzyme